MKDTGKQYDKGNEYKEKIAPLVEALRKECYFLKIPMFFTAAISDTGADTDYKTEMISAAIAEQELSDNKIAKLTNVMNGFETQLPSDITELEYN